MNSDLIEMNGTVVECLPNTKFKVVLESGQVIDAYLSGKLKQNKIRIMLEDEVVLALSPYDLTKGRITWREKKKRGKY